MNITGNPFVDVGFGIAACLAGRSSIEQLSLDDLLSAVGNLRANIEKLQAFKILSSFWANNPFMGKNPGQKPKYEAFLSGLDSGCLPSTAGHCQLCGRSRIINTAITDCQADRCWFPLAGSGVSDPCTLPGLRDRAICAECLAAAIVLPIGCRSCPDGPYFIHVTEPDLQVEAVSEGILAVKTAISVNAGEGIKHETGLRGRVALLDIVSGSILWDQSQHGHMTRIPRGGATAISFSNRGEGPCFNELHLPAQALEFFAAITEVGLLTVFRRWALDAQEYARKFKRKYYLDEICGAVGERRSLAPLLVSFVQSRKSRGLRKEERKVLQIYEDVALQRKERFDTLQRIAGKVRQMPGRYSDSFIKQLGNLGSKRTLLELIKQFCRREGAGLTITPSELRVINDGPVSEIANLLYLLCVVEDDEGGQV